MLNEKEALELAASLCAVIAQENAAHIEQAQQRDDVRESFAEDIAQARARFLAQAPKAAAIFDLAVSHLLERGQPVETLAAALAMTAGVPAQGTGSSQDLWAEIQEAVRLVSLRPERVDDAELVFVAGLLECPSVSARVSVWPNRSKGAPSLRLNGELPGEWVVAASLKPQTSRFSLRRLGELEIGDKQVDDAYIIDAKPGATQMLRHLRGPLVRLAGWCERVEFAPQSVSAELQELPATSAQLAEVVDAALDLWAASVTWCLSLAQDAGAE